ncbi:4Fe-4S dicluster domain-containing protein [Hippea jasoniae]|uniref:4Fe-4S dicluster domain-containing protein n=1 Tax=Hippea jasoniae TaxID=944479 RepID=UPI00068AE0E7|nr:4Fe-4S dicluster domain-containing protein [Hippea jasoniae]
MERRDFVKFLGVTVAGTAIGVGVTPILSKSGYKLLRPPGAIDEKEFLGACIKCGLCVQICPVNCIKLADIDEGLSYQTPYIDARTNACDFSCKGVQCVLVCPTYALEHELAETPEKVRMGLAKVIPDRCLAVKGEKLKEKSKHKWDEWKYKWKVNPDSYIKDVCELCFDKCPIGPSAITMEERKDEKTGRTYQIPVVQQGCTGCGVCEMVCPVEPPAIVIIPREKWGEKNG